MYLLSAANQRDQDAPLWKALHNLEDHLRLAALDLLLAPHLAGVPRSLGLVKDDNMLGGRVVGPRAVEPEESVDVLNEGADLALGRLSRNTMVLSAANEGRAHDLDQRPIAREKDAGRPTSATKRGVVYGIEARECLARAGNTRDETDTALTFSLGVLDRADEGVGGGGQVVSVAM
jgi:hypothetical protein